MIDDIESFEYKKIKKSDGLSWDITPLMIEKFKQKMKVNPSFINVFMPDRNLTKPFKYEVKFRTTGERNIIMEIIGQTGSGKSIVAITISLNIMNKPIIADDIAFTTDELLKRSMAIGKNHTLIQDEQINQLGIGSQRESFEQQTLEDTTRKFGLNIIFYSPTSRNHSTAHYQLEVICINKKKRITKLGLMSDGQQYLGYIILKVVPESNKLWKEYNKRKDEFIKTILNRQTKRLSVDEMSLELKKHKQYKYCKKKGDYVVVASKMFPTLTTQELSMIVDNLILLNRMKEEDGDYLSEE